ncbi:TonB-dependent receptor [Catalinimonas alkaloidigena]|uniref:TonB-dependent receptor n=1 Tax=Catalinimonas alkaloidigena TaxID=1075417 RepID=UPI002405C24E|nr:TonB-dependent receptor [Catalinimonas alkaloidigena]
MTLLLVPGLLSAQSIQLSGIVTDQNGERVGFANVMIKGTTQGTVANDDGTFTLDGLAPGNYCLVVSRVGYEAYVQQLTIADGNPKSLNIQLAELNEELDEVTITATRTTRSVESIPMPVDIISGEEIEQIGSFRLNEVLQEQTGLQIVSDHGTGLQMQGLSSDYILVLIDDEPVIGRTAGTLDLTRIAVDNIARIEIIRGPSSSLYGSEAMAGVVNIITKSGQQGFNSSLRARYRSFNSLGLSAGAGYKGEKLTARLFVDRLSTAGYDLDEETLGMTSPPYEAFTINPKFAYRFSDKVNFSINGRYYTESQDNASELIIEDNVHVMGEEGNREDWNIMPALELKLNDQHRLQLRSYTTGYDTESSIVYQKDKEVYDESYFQQLFNRFEVQYDWYISHQHISTLGLGHTIETVEATRYDDVNNFHANYVFVQHQWLPNDRFNVVLGGRFDTHSEYTSRFSPKLAAGYQLNSWLKLQASFGGGYKAPDFRQLLLNFSNPTAGYTMIGSSIVEERMAELEAQRQIQTIYIDPITIEMIQAGKLHRLQLRAKSLSYQ